MANIVVVDDSDENFIVVGFADKQDGRYREALHFQRSYDFDEQDVALGMDQVYVERNDQSQGVYGGIAQVELHADRVRIVVSDQTTQRLRASAIEIGLSLSSEEYGRLQQALRAVFDGFGLLVEYPAAAGDAPDGGM